MTSEAHGEPITGSSLTASPQILNKKKKIQRIEIEPITSLAPAKILSRRWQRSNPITQYKSKPKSDLSKPNTLTQRIEHRGVYQKKKKKIPNTQTKTKRSNPRTVTSPSLLPQRARRRRRHNGCPSSQIDIDIVDGRSVIGIRLITLPSAPVSGARQPRCFLHLRQSGLPQGFSL